MFLLDSYWSAVIFTIVTMLCWGSWANTQKLAKKGWRFELFYWDYAIGVLLLSLVLGLTMGSYGAAGRPFWADLQQASRSSLLSALLGGAIFNAANILLVAAIDIAGMAVAFPVGIGLAMVLGVLVTYVAHPVGNGGLLMGGVLLVVAAIVLDARAYRKIAGASSEVSTKGLVLSVACGVLMGFFYRFVAAAMYADFAKPEPGKLGPYSAVFVFAAGIFLSNFVLNTFVMKKPFRGSPVTYGEYFRGSFFTHATGVLGGIIWGVGMAFNMIASGKAGFAISYGLGQGATMVAALWGVFVWKEFRDGPAGTWKLTGAMFVCFVVGLSLIIVARLR
ncbi:MAG: GRP family sugar transporter [Candidatus Acidiferrum sp.]